MSEHSWSFPVEDNVVIGEFPPEMSNEEYHDPAIKEAWEEVAARDDVTSHIAVLDLNDSLERDSYKVFDWASQYAVDNGIDQWAIVSDDIKRLAMKKHVRKEGLEVMATDDREEAMEWARD